MIIEGRENVSAFPVLDSLTFPTNEGSFTVRERVVSDSRYSERLVLITSYAGMEELIHFISENAFKQQIEIVFGHEPSLKRRNKMSQNPKKLPDEMRDYWLDRGLSPRTNASVLEVITAIESGRIQTKIHTERVLHAKATVTETAAIFGSSNFSSSGLEFNRELNGRHLYGSNEYAQIKNFADGCLRSSESYDERFLELLRELQLHTTWEEAVARACAAILEGQWAANLLPPELKSEFNNLWPHQKQAVAQALTLLETQGSVAICDPTGSGKTRIGGWVMRLAYNRIIARGGEISGSLIPVMVPPSSVANNWFKILDKVDCPREIIPMGLLSNSRKESTQRRFELIEKTNLLGVDEVHNYYNDRTRRTQVLTSNLAEYRILMSATPINTGYKDLITLMRLSGTEDLDKETYGKMKSLEENIKDPNIQVRELAKKQAKNLIGRFMVRRTRDDLKKLAGERPEEYSIGDRSANYPEYISEEYSIGILDDDELTASIEEDISIISGIATISEITQTAKEKKRGTTEESTLSSRLRLAAAMSRSRIWERLDSSPVALYEHILGTDAAEERFGVKSGKKAQKTVGAIDKLENRSIPIWGLSDDLLRSELAPEWLKDEDSFESHRINEIETYQRILKKSMMLSNNRLNAKLKLIEESSVEHGKVLAFDSSIITLAFMGKKLNERGIETHIFSGGTSGTKKKKVEDAERLFGLNSDSESRVGLMSDSMSEGINLQGSNILIHLTYPTTLRKAEQRVGRVDRMDTEFNEIMIYYPERDSISSKMKAHLKERNKLVGDVIGSNIKLPGMDEKIDEVSESNSKEMEMTSSEMSQSMFSNREGLFDAFHGVRQMIGDDGLVSSETYEMMRTSDARVVSCVGLVRSQKPWCFAVIQTNKDWAPQWIHLDWTRHKATATAGITTDLDEVCNHISQNLKDVDDLDPSSHSDIVIGEYLDHLSKNEIRMLPMRRRALLKQMSEIITHWCRTKYGWETKTGRRLRDLSKAANGCKMMNLDLRQLARHWVSFVKKRRKDLEIKLSSSRKSNLQTVKLLKENPPDDIDSFIDRFSIVEEAEEFDSRILVLIAGIPDMMNWES